MPSKIPKTSVSTSAGAAAVSSRMRPERPGSSRSRSRSAMGRTTSRPTVRMRAHARWSASPRSPSAPFARSRSHLQEGVGAREHRQVHAGTLPSLASECEPLPTTASAAAARSASGSGRPGTGSSCRGRTRAPGARPAGRRSSVCAPLVAQSSPGAPHVVAVGDGRLAARRSTAPSSTSWRPGRRHDVDEVLLVVVGREKDVLGRGTARPRRSGSATDRPGRPSGRPDCPRAGTTRRRTRSCPSPRSRRDDAAVARPAPRRASPGTRRGRGRVRERRAVDVAVDAHDVADGHAAGPVGTVTK